MCRSQMIPVSGGNSTNVSKSNDPLGVTLETCLEFLELLIEGGQVVCLLQLRGLLLQVGELVVEV